MSELPRWAKEVYSGPLTLAEALNRTQELADAGTISLSHLRALRSTAYDCVQEANLTSDGRLPERSEVADTDIRDLLPTLPAFAARAAKRRGHRTPADHVSRARRFVELLVGRKLDTAVRGLPVPEPWQELANALPRSRRSRIRFLAYACITCGVRSPDGLPDRETLIDGAARLLDGDRGTGTKRIEESISLYRKARENLLDSAASPDDVVRVRAAYPAIPRKLRKDLCHLGAEDWTTERVRALGENPDTMTPWEKMRLVVPGISADFEWWEAGGHGEPRSPVTAEATREALQRVVGWIIRGGHADALSSLTCLDLFTTPVVKERASGNRNPRVAARGTGGGTKTHSLLEAMMDLEAANALARSAVTDGVPQGTAPHGLPWITDSLANTVRRVWSLTEAVYGELLDGADEDAETWRLARSHWEQTDRRLKSGSLPSELRVFGKNKELLIRTVTYPHIVCIGLPLRRRQIRRARAEWMAALQKAEVKGFWPNDPRVPDHPEVLRTARNYFEQALPYLALAIALSDGVRAQNYVHGRPGMHFRLTPRRGDDDVPTVLETSSTFWVGAVDDPARLKARGGRKRRAGRDGWELRWGLVDPEILWDYLSWRRPRDLVAAGRIGSLAEYDLASDLAGSPWVLFATSTSGNRQEDAARSDLSTQAGRELHRIASLLRPTLPSWEEVGKDPRWRGLWGLHVTRLLIASYWGGVRNDWVFAESLTMATPKTLQEEYSAVDRVLADRKGLDPSDWENPAAYDSWVDRLYRRREVFDPLEDPQLPLPPGLRDRIAEEEADWERRQRCLDRSIKIRKARPGQTAPQRTRRGRGTIPSGEELERYG